VSQSKFLVVEAKANSFPFQNPQQQHSTKSQGHSPIFSLSCSLFLYEMRKYSNAARQLLEGQRKRRDVSPAHGKTKTTI